MKPKAIVADWKRKEVSNIQEFVQSAPVVGLVDVSGIGAKQMLTMRSSLRDMGVKLRMSRNRLLKLALKDASKNMKGVEQVIDILYLTRLPCYLQLKVHLRYSRCLRSHGHRLRQRVERQPLQRLWLRKVRLLSRQDRL